MQPNITSNWLFTLPHWSMYTIVFIYLVFIHIITCRYKISFNNHFIFCHKKTLDFCWPVHNNFTYCHKSKAWPFNLYATSPTFLYHIYFLDKKHCQKRLVKGLVDHYILPIFFQKMMLMECPPFKLLNLSWWNHVVCCFWLTGSGFLAVLPHACACLNASTLGY